MSLTTILRRTALVLTALFVVGGLLFALGYAWEDMDLWPAVLVTAAVVLPMVGLTVLASRSPSLALKVLVAGVATFAVWAVVTIFVDVEAPTIPVIALILALPIAVVGQRYATRAGELLMAVAAVPVVLLVLQLLSGSRREGAPLRDLLGTSTGVVVIPLALLATILLVAGATGRETPAPERPSVQPPTPAARS